jgi:hypothetical protein
MQAGELYSFGVDAQQDKDKQYMVEQLNEDYFLEVIQTLYRLRLIARHSLDGAQFAPR